MRVGCSPAERPLWRDIDEAASSAARDRLTGRRFLDLEGPFGVGLTTIEVGSDDYCREPAPEEAGVVMGIVLRIDEPKAICVIAAQG